MCSGGDRPSGQHAQRSFTLSVEQQRSLTIEDPVAATPQDVVNVFADVNTDLEVNVGPLSDSERRRLEAPPGGMVPQCLIVGIDRDLDPELVVRGLTASHRGPLARGVVNVLDDGRIVWTARIVSPGATSLRVLVREIDLPEGAKLYVTDGGRQVWGPYLPADGPIWTHSIFGDAVYVQVQIPAAGSDRASNGWSIPAIAHFEEKNEPPVDAAPSDRGPRAVSSAAARGLEQYCRPTTPSGDQAILFERASRAVAKIRWRTGATTWGLCSGGLLRDGTGTGTPFFLTAAHCLNTQSEASTLEAIWNFVRPCGGPVPDESTLPRSLGATLLAHNSGTDFTLLQLRQRPPAGAHYLRWTKNDISGSPTRLYRLSHPSGWSQHYTIAALMTSGMTCEPEFLHSRWLEGGTWGGSSGSPVWRAAGTEPEVVGQLYGWCSSSGANIDGSFALTYPQIERFLGQLPTGDGPKIAIEQAPDAVPAGQRFDIKVKVEDPSGVASVAVIWEATNSTFSCPGTNSEDWWCTHDGSGLYTWTILLGESLDSRRFYVVASDSQGDTSVSETRVIRVLKPAQGHIVFASDRDRERGKRDIWRINADGSGLRRLTRGGGDEQSYAPAWSPDGEYIVFVRDSGPVAGKRELFIMDRNGGNPHLLVADPSVEDQATWAPKPAAPSSQLRGV